MAVKSSLIEVSDLDFDTIASNLKTYLKGQDKFKDYNFEGSNLSLLIDLLAYSSHISAFNTNLAASELFLDSAQIRKNVVSRAKDLGFVPASETGAKAIIEMTLQNVKNGDGTYPTPTEMTLPRGAVFETVYGGSSYNFVVTSSVKPTQNNDKFDYANINLMQGTYVTDYFIHDRQIKNAKYVLSNSRIDRSTIRVSVTSSGISTTYSLSTDVSTITTDSKVYYTQENEEGFTEVYFGDGVLGNELLDGDEIRITYIVIDEDHANGARLFEQISAVNGYSNSTIITIQTATGGGEKESVESIKFKANKFFTSQNRLVTLNDYKAKVKEYYPNADAIAVWGGEDNNPPEYGKVFLAIKPTNSDYLTKEEKRVIVNNLNKLNMITVRPEIVDPEIVDILVSSTFKYNPSLTPLSVGELETIVSNAIVDFDKNNLNNFDAIFRHSKLVRAIDDANSSILSNITNIRLKKQLDVSTKLNQKTGYTVSYGNSLYNPHADHNKASGGILSSTGFYVALDTTNIHYFDEDGSGNLRRYVLSGSTRIYKDPTAGTVNYSTGVVSINAITITSTINSNSSIDFTVIPNSFDVVATRGSLIDISLEDISVSGEVDTIASGETSAGIGYKSTPSSSY
jgi:hypothetical protein